VIGRFIAGLLGGWKAWAAGFGMVLLTSAVFLIRKSGEDAQKLRQAKIDSKAGQIVTKARTDAAGMSDPELNEMVEQWSRK
jgi:hypothetical protein